MADVLLAVMEVLGVSHLVADGQLALGDQVVVAAGDLALDDHDLLHVGAEVDGGDGVADVLGEVIAQGGAPAVHGEGDQLHRQGGLVVALHVAGGHVVQGADLVLLGVPDQGVAHVGSGVGDSHQNGLGDDGADVAGAGGGDAFLGEHGLGQAEGELPLVQLAGGADLKAGDGEGVAVVMGHLLADGDVELHVVLHIFRRHVNALGRGDQLVGQADGLGLFLRRQVVDDIEDLLGVDVGEAGAELFGDALQRQVRALAAEGQLCVFQGEEDLQVLEDLLDPQNVNGFHEVIHVAAGVHVLAAHGQQVGAHVHIVAGGVGSLVGNESNGLLGAAGQLHGEVAGNAQAADQVDIDLFVFSQGFFPDILMNDKVLVPVQEGGIQNLGLGRIDSFLNTLNKAVIFLLSNFHIALSGQCITLAITAGALIGMDVIHGPEDGLYNNFLLQGALDFRKHTHFSYSSSFCSLFFHHGSLL